MKINDEGTSNAAHWHERATEAEARLAKADALLVEACDALPTLGLYDSRLEYLKDLRDRIDDHLSHKGESHE